MALIQQIAWNEVTPSPSIDVTGADRLLFVITHRAVGTAPNTPTAPIIGGVTIPLHYTTTQSGSAAERDVFIATEAMLGAVSGAQTIVCPGTIANTKFIALLYTGRAQTLPAVLNDELGSNRAAATLNTALLTGDDFLQVLTSTNPTGPITFNQGRAALYDENPGSPNARVAYSSITANADVAALDYTVSKGAASTNYGSIGFVLPAAVGASEGPYRTGVTEGAQLQLASTLAPDAVPNVTPGARVWIQDDGGGARTFNADGTFTTTEPGTITAGYWVLDEVAHVWEYFETDLTGSGTIGTITFANDLFHGNDEAFTTTVDLTGVTNATIEFSDGTGTSFADVEEGGLGTGIVGFSLFTAFGNDDVVQPGIEAATAQPVTLLVDDIIVATGTYRGRGPVGGLVSTPTAAPATALPNLVVGNQFLIFDLQGGTSNANGVYTRGTDAAFTLEYFTHDAGVWTIHTLDFPALDTVSPVVITPIPDIAVTQPAAVSATPDLDDAIDATLDYTFTVNGVAGAAPWVQTAADGEVTLADSSALAPGVYNVVVRGTDDAGNFVEDDFTVTIAAPAVPGTIYPQIQSGVSQFVPGAGRSYENVGTRDTYPLPGVLSDHQIEYDNLSGTLTIGPDGVEQYTGTTVQTIQVRFHDGINWGPFQTLTVYPALDLETPSWVPPVVVPLASLTSFLADDLYNIGLNDPRAVVTIEGFPGVSAVSGLGGASSINVDTTTAGTFPVVIHATVNGHDIVSIYFDLLINDSLLSVAGFSQGHTLAEVSHATVNLDLAEMSHLHSLEALPGLVYSLVLDDDLAHGHELASVPIEIELEVSGRLQQGHALEQLPLRDQNLQGESLQHGHALDAAPLLDVNLPTINLRQKNTLAAMGALQRLTIGVESIEQGHTLESLIALGFPLLLDAALQHGQTLDTIDGVLDMGLPGLVGVSHVQLVDEIGGPLQIGALVLDVVTQGHTLDDVAAVPNTPLMLTGGITQQHTVQALVNMLQTNSVLTLDEVIHAQFVGGSVPLTLSNTPLIPADGIVVIRSKTIQ